MTRRTPRNCPVMLYEVTFWDENWCELELLRQTHCTHWDLLNLFKVYHHDRVNLALGSITDSIYRDVFNISVEVIHG